MLRARWIPLLVIRINVSMRLRSLPRPRRTRIGNQPRRIWLNIRFLPLIIFIPVVMCQKSCFLTVRKSLCIALMRKISRDQFAIVNIHWVWVRKFMKFNLILRELIRWLLVLMIIIYFQLDRKDSLFVMNSRIKSRRTKWKFQISLSSFYIQSKSLLDRKNFLISLKLKTLMLSKNGTSQLDNQKPNMIVWLTNGISKFQREKETKNNDMIDKFSK